MPTTPINALRYPALTDSPNGPLQVQNLATDVDNQLPRVRTSQGVASGTPPTSDKPMLVQGFSRIVTTNVNGDATISFPVTFATGVASVVVSSGDLAAGNHAYAAINSTATNSINTRHYQPGGAVCASVTVRVNVVAVGW